ncbi:hypothetical protein C7M84_016165 [Penaeus vannamei]|uniref:Uncharacterized protein n=1 Tax=Penaeus vannamei TaxID=6689 RepID=A0A423SNW0_PENVA|nr:hypothetical protein C7M84_016165 [Penaeus vannamei]
MAESSSGNPDVAMLRTLLNGAIRWGRLGIIRIMGDLLQRFTSAIGEALIPRFGRQADRDRFKQAKDAGPRACVFSSAGPQVGGGEAKEARLATCSYGRLGSVGDVESRVVFPNIGVGVWASLPGEEMGMDDAAIHVHILHISGNCRPSPPCSSPLPRRAIKCHSEEVKGEKTEELEQGCGCRASVLAAAVAGSRYWQGRGLGRVKVLARSYWPRGQGVSRVEALAGSRAVVGGHPRGRAIDTPALGKSSPPLRKFPFPPSFNSLSPSSNTLPCLLKSPSSSFLILLSLLQYPLPLSPNTLLFPPQMPPPLSSSFPSFSSIRSSVTRCDLAGFLRCDLVRFDCGDLACCGFVHLVRSNVTVFLSFATSIVPSAVTSLARFFRSNPVPFLAIELSCSRPRQNSLISRPVSGSAYLTLAAKCSPREKSPPHFTIRHVTAIASASMNFLPSLFRRLEAGVRRGGGRRTRYSPLSYVASRLCGVIQHVIGSLYYAFGSLFVLPSRLSPHTTYPNLSSCYPPPWPLLPPINHHLFSLTPSPPPPASDRQPLTHYPYPPTHRSYPIALTPTSCRNPYPLASTITPPSRSSTPTASPQPLPPLLRSSTPTASPQPLPPTALISTNRRSSAPPPQLYHYTPSLSPSHYCLPLPLPLSPPLPLPIPFPLLPSSSPYHLPLPFPHLYPSPYPLHSPSPSPSIPFIPFPTPPYPTAQPRRRAPFLAFRAQYRRDPP